MRYFLHIFCHELRVIILSSSTYLVSFLFLSLMAILYWAVLVDYSHCEQDSLPWITLLNVFWIPSLITVPLLTMRSISQERKYSHLESIFTTPIKPYQWVLSKFLSVYCFYLFLWLLTLSFPIISALSIDDVLSCRKLLDPWSISGGFLYIGLSGCLYISIGIFSSSITSKQLTAGMVTFVILFIVIVGGRLLTLFPQHVLDDYLWQGAFLDYFQTFNYLDDFCLNKIDTRPLVFYLFNSVILLWITSLIVETKA